MQDQNEPQPGTSKQMTSRQSHEYSNLDQPDDFAMDLESNTPLAPNKEWKIMLGCHRKTKKICTSDSEKISICSIRKMPNLRPRFSTASRTPIMTVTLHR